MLHRERSTAVQQCVFENIVAKNVHNGLKKNANISKPSNQSKGLGGTIGCKGYGIM